MGRLTRILLVSAALTMTSCGSDEPSNLFDGYLPSLDRVVTVVDILFYETGYEDLPVENRTYATTFKGAETRFISWELRLLHPSIEHHQEFQIHSTYLNKNGTPVGITRHTTWIEPTWEGSHHSAGYGDEYRRFWRHQSGRFTVDIGIEETHLGTATFKIR